MFGQIPAKARDLLSVLGELLHSRLQIPLQDVGLSPDLEELLLELRHQPFELGPDRFEGPRLSDLGQDQKQDDGAEAAADDVEKRQAHYLELTPGPLSSLHGQSLDGLTKAPPVTMASFQKALAAIGSPSMGKRITLIGILSESSRAASSKSFTRSLLEMVVRLGGLLP